MNKQMSFWCDTAVYERTLQSLPSRSLTRWRRRRRSMHATSAFKSMYTRRRSWIFDIRNAMRSSPSKNWPSSADTHAHVQYLNGQFSTGLHILVIPIMTGSWRTAGGNQCHWHWHDYFFPQITTNFCRAGRHSLLCLLPIPVSSNH